MIRLEKLKVNLSIKII